MWAPNCEEFQSGRNRVMTCNLAEKERRRIRARVEGRRTERQLTEAQGKAIKAHSTPALLFNSQI